MSKTTKTITTEIANPEVHTKRIVTIHEPSDIQVDSQTLEKALEVSRITLKQELTRQFTQAKTEVALAHNRIGTLEKKFIADFERLELAKQKKNPAIKKAAAALSELFNAKVFPSTIVESVVISPSAGYSHSRTSLSNCVHKDGNKVGVSVQMSIKAPIMVTRKQMEEEELEDEVEVDTAGRTYLSCESTFSWVVLSKDQQKEMNEIVKAKQAAENATNHKEEVERRLKSIAEQSDALKAQIYRKQIGETKGGAEILEMMDNAAQATLSGDYLRLL